MSESPSVNSGSSSRRSRNYRGKRNSGEQKSSDSDTKVGGDQPAEEQESGFLTPEAKQKEFLNDERLADLERSNLELQRTVSKLLKRNQELVLDLSDDDEDFVGNPNMNRAANRESLLIPKQDLKRPEGENLRKTNSNS